jgi:transposase-like protein
MRLNLTGDSPIVETLKKHFKEDGIILTDTIPHYTVELVKGYREEPGGKIIDGPLTLTSQQGKICNYITKHLFQLTSAPLLVHFGENEFGMQIKVPSKLEYAVEHAVVRAVNELREIKHYWLKRWLSR